jgi:hypothetical protein
VVKRRRAEAAAPALVWEGVATDEIDEAQAPSAPTVGGDQPVAAERSAATAEAFAATPPPRSVQETWAVIAMPTAWAVIIALVLGALAAFAGADYERTRIPIYESSAILLLDNPVAITADPTLLIGVSQARAKYAGLAQTDLIAVPAAAKLGLPSSVVAGSVRATFDVASLNIVVAARSVDPKQAPILANAVAAELVDYVATEQAHLPPTVKPELRLRMELVTRATYAARLSPNHKKEETTGVVFGVIAFAVSYVGAQVIIDARRRRRGRRQKVTA